MSLAASIVIGFIAALHVYILVLEMFLWNRAVRVFGIAREHRDNESMRTMLKNQGLYNGFLAAGLIWGLVHPDADIGYQVQIFFAACVGVAGLYGAATANIRILFVQTVPAAIALGLLLASRM